MQDPEILCGRLPLSMTSKECTQLGHGPDHSLPSIDELMQGTRPPHPQKHVHGTLLTSLPASSKIWYTLQLQHIYGQKSMNCFLLCYVGFVMSWVGFCNKLCGFCNECVCVGFVMCGCFGNMYTVLWLRFFLTWHRFFLPWLMFFFVLFPQL
jgi:hypothetical protein